MDETNGNEEAHEPKKQGLLGRLTRLLGTIKQNVAAVTPQPTPEARAATVVQAARSKFRAHEYEEALAKADEVLTLVPEHPEASFIRGMVLFGQKRRPEALAALKTSMEHDPRVAAQIEEALQGLAQATAHDDVLVLADVLLASNARNVRVLAMKAAALLGQDRLDEAEMTAHSVHRLDPASDAAKAVIDVCAARRKGDPVARARQLVEEGQAHLDAGRLELALASLTEAGHLDARDPGVPAGTSLILVALNRREEALPEFDKVIALRPDWIDPLLQKADCLETLGRYEDAIALFDRALALEPNNVNALHDRAHCLTKLGRTDDALAAYKRVLELKPDMTLAWFNRAGLERQDGRVIAAIASYERYLELAPADHPARQTAEADLATLRETPVARTHGTFEQAVVLAEAGDHAGAVVLHDQILEIFAESWPALHHKGISLEALGRPQEALACYDRASRLAPREAAVHLQRATCLFRMERFEEALRGLHRALELQPEGPLRPMAVLHRARSLMALARTEEALVWYQEALQTFDHQNLLIEAGACLQAVGRPDEAKAMWERVAPIEARRWFHVGMAARLEGNEELAAELLGRAEEGFLRIEFDKRAPDPIEAQEVKALWMELGDRPVPEDASPFVRALLERKVPEPIE